MTEQEAEGSIEGMGILPRAQCAGNVATFNLSVNLTAAPILGLPSKQTRLCPRHPVRCDP